MDLQSGEIRHAELTRSVEEYFQLFFEGLHRYAFTFLRDNDAAKDAVQEVFVRLWEKRERLDASQSVKAYLYTSVYHYCLNIKRHEKVKREYTATQQEPAAVSNDTLLSKEAALQIRKALDSLPPQCRLIFCKSRFEDKKYAAIAAEMNLSVKTVEAQMGKALKILRQKLSGLNIAILILLLI